MTAGGRFLKQRLNDLLSVVTDGKSNIANMQNYTRKGSTPSDEEHSV